MYPNIIYPKTFRKVDNYIPNVSIEECKLLYDTIKEIGINKIDDSEPIIVTEVGTGDGYVTLWLTSAILSLFEKYGLTKETHINSIGYPQNDTELFDIFENNGLTSNVMLYTASLKGGYKYKIKHPPATIYYIDVSMEKMFDINIKEFFDVIYNENRHNYDVFIIIRNALNEKFNNTYDFIRTFNKDSYERMYDVEIKETYKGTEKIGLAIFHFKNVPDVPKPNRS